MPQTTGPGAPTPDLVEDDMHIAIKDTQHQLGAMLVRARKSFRARAAEIHPELQPMGYSALLLLSRGGTLHQASLPELLDTDKATVSRLIKQLEGLGLVFRMVDPDDARAQLVSLSAQGQQRYEVSMSVAHQLLVDRLSQWDVAEVRRFAELLSRLNEDPI
ncbi:MarR family winged helix-turn-helix transcriptional regulator [Specibacter sp. NPDC057265]|uniref:MarR family winged helix-turn-helix transcriptional regulator n=1 Tax=Specibacter sp. NPDC057265 TaxID=3346075 RepID=UPI00364039B6